MRRILIAVKAISGHVSWVSWIKQSTLLLLADCSREVVLRRPAVVTAEWCLLLWMGSDLGHSLWPGGGGNLCSIVWEYEFLTLFTVNYVIWRFIILTYPFNVVHNVKFLRFRLVILRIGLYGGSQKFVRLFFWGGGTYRRGTFFVFLFIFLLPSYSRLIPLLSLLFCIILLRIHIYLHDFHFNHLSSHVRPLETCSFSPVLLSFIPLLILYIN